MHNDTGIKHCSHEFHISNANDEPTHIATYDDIFQKPIAVSLFTTTINYGRCQEFIGFGQQTSTLPRELLLLPGTISFKLKNNLNIVYLLKGERWHLMKG